MANAKNKVDFLHGNMPELYSTRTNQGWKAMIEAIGQQDQFLANLLEEVRQQFFVKTANRPYLDRLGSNVLVNRPRFIGMDDPTFRKYIPVLSYQPKQVKLIIDTLLDIFFFKESTTAFTETSSFEPFSLQNGWELEYLVDGYKTERVEFKNSDFTDINNATAEEIVATINRQSKHSFSIVFDNSVTKRKTIRLFTNTIGSKGSIEITGGRANIDLRFAGFIEDSGNSNNTQWDISKIGETVTFQYVAGGSPGIEFLRDGDIAIIDIPGNSGSFKIRDVDIGVGSFSFTNLFATVGPFTQTSARQIKFIRPLKSVVYTENRRAVAWETGPGKAIVEMPASPPVVRRTLEGSAHINGKQATVINVIGDTQLELDSTAEWPESGTFILRPLDEIKTKIVTPDENSITTYTSETRVHGFDQKYSYESISGNSLIDVSPPLPQPSDINEFDVTTITRNVQNIITVNTIGTHNFNVGEYVIINDSVPSVGPPHIEMLVPANGTHLITEILGPNSFRAFSFGDEGQSTGGTARVERFGISLGGSRVLLTSSISESISRIKGPYIWDLEAPFVLSSQVGNTVEQIRAGQIKKTLQIGSNNIPNEASEVMFNFGTEAQEGPIRCLFKPSSESIALDPAYIFQNDHPVGSTVTVLRTRGPHIMSGNGSEVAPYITDTAVAREILQELIQSVKSAGIFIEFLVRFPQQLYGTIDVYRSGKDPGP
jgi:hypothetical protein